MIKCNSGVQMGSEEETHGNHGKPPAARFYCSITIGGLGSPDPTQTISLIKKESFKSIIKSREGVYLPNSYWELVPQIQTLLPALLL